MKKLLLTVGAVAAFASGASGQAALDLTYLVGFNTATSNPNDANLSDWFTGNVIMQIYTIPAAGNASLANTINADEQNVVTEFSGIGLIWAYFTQQEIGTVRGSMLTEAPYQTLQISEGSIVNAEEGIYDVGTSATLPETTPIYYALLFTTVNFIAEGAVVMNNPAAGYLPSTSPPNNMNSEYPANDQNIIFDVPEPATLALAGLGGLSMLFLRRRKA